jgi:threonyl-tRNA synthetase
MATYEKQFKAISRNSEIRVVPDVDEALEILRHSTSHLMALAVMDLFPEVHLGIGPPTGEGFYYDFQTSHRLTDEDLPRIEERMRELAEQNLHFVPKIVSLDEAIEMFSDRGEALKVELIRDRSEQTLSSYALGDLVDFCLGPHMLDTSQVGAFKLLSVAGSYWRGDEKREQLQRIYGTAFFTGKELRKHLERLAEARKRDHRKLGRELDLFSIREEVAPGLIFWHPKGAIVREEVEQFLREELKSRGYSFVYTPHIAKSELWKVSGHYEYFRDNMYAVPVDGEDYFLKPMNCPGHILVYQSAKRSYRELPIRIAEFGTVYRREKSGTLHGMLRVRGFTQDDAHIFCSPDQVLDEVVSTLDLAEYVLRSFGFEDFKVALSIADWSSPKEYAGQRENWEKAEAVLTKALETRGWDYDVCKGEAAFYGPKIDIQLIDALGRTWQLSTFQFDFNLPERFGVKYVGSDSKEHHVVMIHRALLGSLERFMGILIEHYGGAFPTWLAPVQALILPISERHHEYALKVEGQLISEGLRVETDLRSEKVGYKIREAQIKKVPFMLVVGDREIENGTVSVRSRSDGDQGSRTVDQFSSDIKQLIQTKDGAL